MTLYTTIQKTASTTIAATFQPTHGGLLQRTCACGGTAGPTGECAACRRKRVLGHPIQAKLRINQPDDRFEQEADRVADQVMRMSEPSLQRDRDDEEEEELLQPKLRSSQVMRMPEPGLQRDRDDEEEEELLQPKLRTSQVMRMPEPGLQRDRDDEEEEELLQSKPGTEHHATGDADRRLAPPIVHDVLGSPGKSLEPSTQQFMESRFGHDFSRVRVHTGGEAAESAQAVNARAYTVGSNIVFGSGEYAPDSNDGRRLLAHELVHVTQQSTVPAIRTLQRWTLGTGTPPHSDYRVVPKAHEARVDEARKLLERVVNNPKGFPRCHRFFQDNCPGGTAATLKSKFDSATVWRDTDTTVFGSGVSGDNVAYSDLTFRIGRWFIAGVMMHEFMHRCGQHNENTNDRAIKACGFRDVEIQGGKVVEK